MAEEVEKSSAAGEPTNSSPRAQSLDDGEEPEEGEIVTDDDESQSKQSTTVIAPPQLHPLENSWTFWFDNTPAKLKLADWGSYIGPVYTFSSIEDFWGLYNNINRPSKLAVGADFYCFKDNIKPKWEDPIYANGGAWTVSFPKGKSDTSWLYTLLAMIGEQFDHGEEICGAVVNVRAKLDKIALWTKNAANEVAQISIGKQWKEFLDYNDSIGFVFHDDAKKQGRLAKNRYNV